MNNNNNNNFYLIINSVTQIPNFDFSISPIQWKPCAANTLHATPFLTVCKDPYIVKLTGYFLKNNIICSNELCQTIPFCHSLWLALHLSNEIKIKLNYNYFNQYIHPVRRFNSEEHERQHFFNKLGYL
jgi:hypothetical protein